VITILALKRFGTDESGPAAAEYAVMLALMLVAVLAVVGAVGGTSSKIWSSNTKSITDRLGG
jgi:pilus assembly protein Flp/PilA